MNTSSPNNLTADGQKKFLFDREFGPQDSVPTRTAATPVPAPGADEATDDAHAEPVEIAVEEVAILTFSAEDLAQARKESHTAGHNEAIHDMSSAIEQRLANTLDAINTQMASLFDAYAQDKEDRNRDAISVATVIVRKLFPTLNTENAMGEIEHVILEAMKRTSGNPTLMIKVPQDLHKDIEVKTAELAALRGCEATINIITDTNITDGNISIEWDGGGMVRDTDLTWREIDQIIERNLGPRTAAQPQDSIQEVVKQAAVGENEDRVLESQTDAKRSDAEPTQPGAGPDGPQHTD